MITFFRWNLIPSYMTAQLWWGDLSYLGVWGDVKFWGDLIWLGGPLTPVHTMKIFLAPQDPPPKSGGPP